MQSWPIFTGQQVSGSWEVIRSCLINYFPGNKREGNFFCLVSATNQSFLRYDVQTDREKQLVSSAVHACWPLAEQLLSGMGSS